MKKKLIGVFAALALFAGCLGLVACGEEKDPCADGHDWGEWSVTKAATCTEKGSRTRSCKNGDKTETEEIPMLAHTYDATETNYCTVCMTYYVGTEAQLRELSSKTGDFAGKTIKLTADITLSEDAWTPICKGVRSGKELSAGFAGIFDGAGKTISNLTVSTSPANADEGVGFFSCVKGGTVKNLKLSEISVEALTCEMAGGVSGGVSAGGKIENCTVSGSIKVGRGVGGIAGRVLETGSVSDCVNDAAIEGVLAGGNVAGIVGAMYYVGSPETLFIADCVNNGSIKGATGTGGIVGLLTTGKVSGCVNNGKITATGGTSIGGIAGEMKSGGILYACENKGDIAATASWVGGIVGWIRYDKGEAYASASGVGRVENCNNSGKISATGGDLTAGTGRIYSFGGIVGGAYNWAEIENCENSGALEVKGNANMTGGVIGNVQHSADNKYFEEKSVSVTNCKNTSTSISEEAASGMVHTIVGHVGNWTYTVFEDCTSADIAGMTTGIQEKA